MFPFFGSHSGARNYDKHHHQQRSYVCSADPAYDQLQPEGHAGNVSSGLRVGSASDNAAYWSIATTMRSDNGALSAVSDALGLGAAKVDTAYAGMNAAIDVVAQIKTKLVTATEEGVDKNKVQEEISQLQEQLRSVARIRVVQRSKLDRRRR